MIGGDTYPLQTDEDRDPPPCIDCEEWRALHRQLATARADALEEAAKVAERYAESAVYTMEDAALSNVAAAIRALIPPQEK